MPALEAADRAVTGWRHEVVEHFRAARRAIKTAALPDSDGIYAKAKAVELEAERLLQRQLASRAPVENVGLPTERRVADALANLALYVGDAPAAPIADALKAMAETDFRIGYRTDARQTDRRGDYVVTASISLRRSRRC